MREAARTERPSSVPLLGRRSRGWLSLETLTALVVQRRILLSAVVLFLALAAAYVFSMDIRASRGSSITGDEPFYLLTTQSLIRDGDLDLRNQYAAGSYREFFDYAGGLWRQSVPLADGRLLSPHNPGLSALVVPGYLAGGLAGVQVQLLLLAGLTFALTYVLAARLTGKPWTSWLATAAVGVSATAFVYATEVYPEVPAALALVTALLLATGRRPLGVGTSLLLALVLAAMPWLGIKYVALVLPLGGYAMFRAGNGGRAVLAGAGLALGAHYLWFHWHTFGALTPYSINVVYAGMDTTDTVKAHVELWDRLYRLVGLFVDQRFGVGRWAPVLLAALPGCVLLWRGGGPHRLLLALLETQVLVATFVAVTMMGWWFPGRTLMATLPLLAVPLAMLATRTGPAARAVLLALGLYSAAITVALARAGHAREITVAVNPFDLASPLFRVASPLFPDYTSWTLGTWALTIGWSAIAVLAAWLAWHLPTKRREATSKV